MTAWTTTAVMKSEDHVFCGQDPGPMTHVISRTQMILWVQRGPSHPVTVMCGVATPINWAGITANYEDMCPTCLGRMRKMIMTIGGPEHGESKDRTK